MTLFVRNLPNGTTETSLNELFSAHGKVHAFKLNRDLFSGQSRGTATVSMEGHEARAAIKAWNGIEIDGKTLCVDLDKGLAGGGKRR